MVGGPAGGTIYRNSGNHRGCSSRCKRPHKVGGEWSAGGIFCSGGNRGREKGAVGKNCRRRKSRRVPGVGDDSRYGSGAWSCQSKRSPINRRRVHGLAERG